MSRRYPDAEIYACYERLGSGVLVGLELGLSQSHVSSRLRIYRRDVLGVTSKMIRLSGVPRHIEPVPQTTPLDGPFYGAGGGTEPKDWREQRPTRAGTTPVAIDDQGSSVAPSEPSEPESSENLEIPKHQEAALPALDNPRAKRTQALPVGNASLVDARIFDARLATIERRMDALLAGVDRILRRPPMIVEWRPQHKRVADGGMPVRDQRRLIGQPKRIRRIER